MDVHHMLPEFWQANNEGDHPAGGNAPPPWSQASALSFLDDAGIDVAVTSTRTFDVQGDNASKADFGWPVSSVR